MTPADHAEKLAHAAQTTAYTSAAGGLIFGLTASEWGAIAAIVSAVSGNSLLSEQRKAAVLAAMEASYD